MARVRVFTFAHEFHLLLRHRRRRRRRRRCALELLFRLALAQDSGLAGAKLILARIVVARARAVHETSERKESEFFSLAKVTKFSCLFATTPLESLPRRLRACTHTRTRAHIEAMNLALFARFRQFNCAPYLMARNESSSSALSASSRLLLRNTAQGARENFCACQQFSCPRARAQQLNSNTSSSALAN